MPYQYKADHLKKKAGRPRKYENCPRPNKKYIQKKLNIQQTAEKLRGVPLIQLDYETGEYIDEYPSLTSIALDYNIPLGTLLGKLNKDHCCMIKIPKYQLLLIRKHHYESMIKRDNV